MHETDDRGHGGAERAGRAGDRAERRTADGLHAQATVEHLHRLIGSVAFFGATPLERRGQLLIEAINRDGVAMHLPRLLALRSDLIGYLNYLSALGNG